MTKNERPEYPLWPKETLGEFKQFTQASAQILMKEHEEIKMICNE